MFCCFQSPSLFVVATFFVFATFTMCCQNVQWCYMNATYWLVETIGDEDQASGEHGTCIYQHTKKKYVASSFHFSHLFSFTFCLRCTILFFFLREGVNCQKVIQVVSSSSNLWPFYVLFIFSFCMCLCSKVHLWSNERGGRSFNKFHIYFVAYHLASSFSFLVFLCVLFVFFFLFIAKQQEFQKSIRGVGCKVKLEKSLEGSVGKSK
jgi:hypothetical protein